MLCASRAHCLLTATMLTLGLLDAAAAANGPEAQSAGLRLAANDFDLPLGKRWTGDKARSWARDGGKGGSDAARFWSRLRKWRESQGGSRSDSKAAKSGWPWWASGDKKGWTGWKGRDEQGWRPSWKGDDKDRHEAPWNPRDQPWQRYGGPWDQWRRYLEGYYGPGPGYGAYSGDGRYPYPAAPYYDAYERGDHRDEMWGWIAFTAVALKLLDNLNQEQQRAHERAMARAESAPIGESVRWSQGAAHGSVTPTRASRPGEGRPCREFRHEVVVDGRKQIAYETACQAPDGSWQILR